MNVVTRSAEAVPGGYKHLPWGDPAWRSCKATRQSRQHRHAFWQPACRAPSPPPHAGWAAPPHMSCAAWPHDACAGDKLSERKQRLLSRMQARPDAAAPPPTPASSTSSTPPHQSAPVQSVGLPAAGAAAGAAAAVAGLPATPAPSLSSYPGVEELELPALPELPPMPELPTEGLSEEELQVRVGARAKDLARVRAGAAGARVRLGQCRRMCWYVCNRTHEIKVVRSRSVLPPAACGICAHTFAAQRRLPVCFQPVSVCSCCVQLARAPQRPERPAAVCSWSASMPACRSMRACV